MIYIYTTKTDITTNYIIDWLNKYNHSYKRVNSEDFYSLFDIDFNNYNPTDVHWFWKWVFPSFSLNNYTNNYNNNQYNEALKTEYYVLYQLYFDNYVNKIVNHPHFVDIDKFSQIQIAKKCGLLVPDTIITSNKVALEGFYKKHGRIITKNFSASLTLNFDSAIYKSYTSEVDNEFIKSTSPNFFPSLFQEYIKKKFEIRTIYIDGKFYSCALLSNSSKELDIRESTNNNSVKMVPYKLPQQIEIKICDFMKSINLQIGSLDILYTKQNEYIFLEVNPSGQFLGYSSNCNYNVEKSIAEYLISRVNGSD